MSSKIVPLIPKHTVYVEPFCGSAAIMFRKPLPKVTNNHHYREVLNDKNGRVINLFKVLRDHGEELHWLLEQTPYSRTEHKASQEGHANPIEDARRFFVDVMQGFGKSPGGGWGFGKNSENHAGTFQRTVDRLPDAIERLRGTFIENIDAVECIKKWDSPTSFFYCDPPYVNTNQGHYSGYGEEDLKALCDTLDGVQGSFILSSYDNEICNSYGWEKREFVASSSINNTGTGKGKKRIECVWMRGPTVGPSEKMKKILERPEFDVFKGWNP